MQCTYNCSYIYLTISEEAHVCCHYEDSKEESS